MYGRHKCELLKSIRKTIADMNGIEYEPTPCDYDGECPGTCPRCDQESAWLMSELRRKEAAGSPIRIGVESLEELENIANDEFDDERYVTMGLPAPPDDEDLVGNMIAPEEMRLQGDIADSDDDDTEENKDD